MVHDGQCISTSKLIKKQPHFMLFLRVGSSYSSLDWVLSHWVHFTVHSLDLVVFICVYFVFFAYCIYVVLFSAQWGGSNGIEAWSLGLLFLQCFDTVGWVF